MHWPTRVNSFDTSKPSRRVPQYSPENLRLFSCLRVKHRFMEDSPENLRLFSCLRVKHRFMEDCWLIELLLNRLREAQLVKARGRQRTDSTHVLAAVQALHRLECVGEILRHALDILARIAPIGSERKRSLTGCQIRKTLR